MKRNGYGRESTSEIINREPSFMCHTHFLADYRLVGVGVGHAMSVTIRRDRRVNYGPHPLHIDDPNFVSIAMGTRNSRPIYKIKLYNF